jgi:hypothetical protein
MVIDPLTLKYQGQKFEGWITVRAGHKSGPADAGGSEPALKSLDGSAERPASRPNRRHFPRPPRRELCVGRPCSDPMTQDKIERWHRRSKTVFCSRATTCPAILNASCSDVISVPISLVNDKGRIVHKGDEIGFREA